MSGINETTGYVIKRGLIYSNYSFPFVMTGWLGTTERARETGDGPRTPDGATMPTLEPLKTYFHS